MKNIVDDQTIDKLNKSVESPEVSSENNVDKKIDGAVAEVTKRAERDQAVENNLSTGLNNPEFKKASRKIDKKRKVYTSGFSLILKKDLPSFEKPLKSKNNPTTPETIPPFILDDEYRQSMKELEEEMTDSFNKEVYGRLAEMNKVLLLDHLVDNILSQDKSEIINLNVVSDGNYNVVAFSDTGYLMQLANKEEIKTEDGFDIKNEKAQYNLIAPDGTVLFEKQSYEDTFDALEKMSNGYLNNLKEEFNQVENNLENTTEAPAETEEIGTEESVNNSNVSPKTPEVSVNKLEFEPSPLFNKFVLSKFGKWVKDNLEMSLKDQDISRQAVQVWERQYILGIVSYSSVGYSTFLTNIEEVKTENGISTRSEKAVYSLINPEGVAIVDNLSYQDAERLLWSESESYLEKLNQEFESNKEEIEKELVDSDAAENNNEISEPEPVPEFKNSFNENVSNYAESIGIDPEELAANLEFVSLTPEQQQFALETLRRSSLAKAKVEGYESFIKEKASKSWWKFGFALNQNYHKERHKIEAVQNIESRGLEGYGETELNWLIEVIKTGPEVKVNEAGEVIVDCLSENSFSEEQKELVAKYNEVAREYIETSKDKDNDELQKELDGIKIKLLNSAEDDNQLAEVNNLLFKSKNNIDLLKFLSADKETEKLLDKMAETSFSGLDKVKAMAGAQKDKAGYAALGFTLRTGAKFALANSAYLASAISYGVGPMVAAIVGGFRGHNQGKKELIEKEELAKLGIKDQSSTAKVMNLATGEKNGINFGLTEKLQNLVDKLKEETREEEIEKIKKELNLRIEYTENKINNEKIDYGSISERNHNYFNLINTVAEAKSLIGKSAVHREINSYWVDDDITKLTRGKLNDKKMEALAKLSVHDRLASFLNYREKKQNQKELNFLIKKTATGAVMGATFAAAGAFVAEQLGVSSWLSGKNISSEDAATTSSNSNSVEDTTIIKSSPADTSAVKSPSSAAEQVVATESAAPKVAKFVDEISNKGLGGKNDSVWRSTREIFKNNAEVLGYKGDLNNVAAINQWAETQTANTISNSGEINDKIFEGNKVSLIKDGDHFKAVVEQAQGEKPGQLNHEIQTGRQTQSIEDNKMTVKLIDENVIENLNSEPEVYNLPETPIAKDSLLVNSKDISDLFHVKSADLQPKGNGFVYNKGMGQVLFDNVNGKIEIAFTDKNGSTIPDSFINEIKGKNSLNKFISKDLDKTFKAWNKLSNDDRSLYQLLGGRLAKGELLDQIKIQFKLDDNVWVTPDNKFGIQTGLNKNEYFDLNFNGVKKMLKVIAKLK